MDASSDLKELLKKVRTVEIKAKNMSKNLFMGDAHSPFKGKGMTFSEVRSYQYGDDVKSIDWNVTARSGSPYVKIFEEEHELTVFFLVDCSGSSYFGSKQNRFQLISEVAAVLSLSALHYQHKLGLMLFSDKLDFYLPPKKGASQMLRIIREILNQKPKIAKTNIGDAISQFIKHQHQRCTCFILSDFQDINFEKQLKVMSKIHDVVGIKFNEISEQKFPDLGLVEFKNIETGKWELIDTSAAQWRKNQQADYEKSNTEISNYFIHSNCDLIQIDTEKPYLPKLKSFFQKRHSA
jgi:uncharacterized protein (DUF58 family)